MKQPSVDALQECLERIEAGESPAEALSRHPELRRELEPRLASAMTLRANRPGPAPAFDGRMRERLKRVDADRTPGELHWLRWQPMLLRAAAVLLAVGLSAGSGKLALAALVDLPEDHWLKPVAVRVDRVRSVVHEYVEIPLPGALREASDDRRLESEFETEGADTRVDEQASLPDPLVGAEVRSRSSESAIGGDTRDDRERPVTRSGDVSSLLETRAAATEAAASASASAPGSAPVVPSVATPTTASAGGGIALVPPSATVVRFATSAPPQEPPPPGADEPRDPNPVIPEDPPDPDEPTAEPSPRPTALDHTPVPPPTRAPTQAPVFQEGSLAGRVSWKEGGRRLEGTVEIIVVRAEACPRPGRRDPEAVAKLRSERDGSYRVGALPAGDYRIGVLPQFVGGGRHAKLGFGWHYRSSSCENSDVVTVTGGAARENVDIQLRDDDRGRPGPGDGPGERRGPGGSGSGSAEP